MSMRVLGVLQIIEIFSLYSFVTILLPALVLHKKVAEQRLSIRLLTYYMVGSFYVINLVYALELLHISNRFTLILCTALTVAVAMVRVNRYPLKATLRMQFQYIRKLSQREIGIRSLLLRIGLWLKGRAKQVLSWAKQNVLRHLPDWLLFAALTALICWIYGSNALRTYGYCASDIPVHNFWINYMSRDNQIFVDGVYPFGFHCTIYYLHTVFQIPTFTLLRLFWVVQTLFVHYMLLAFLKGCCRYSYLAYAGTGLYAAGAMFAQGTYSRFYSTLPQEFGMIFLWPSIYYLFAFFKQKKGELEHCEWKKVSKWYLVLFGMSFSMTLAIHFYGTIIAAMFCLAIGLAYGFRFFKRAYFGPVMLAGLLSIAVAILPMGIAFALGTPLQGSLNWALGVMSGDGENEDADEDEGVPGEEGQSGEDAQDGENPANESENAGNDASNATGQAVQTPQKEEEAALSPSLSSRMSTFFSKIVMGKLRHCKEVFAQSIDRLVSDGENPMMHRAVFAGMLALVVLSMAFFLLRSPDYAAMLLSTALFALLMSVLLSASALGLPELMDGNRCSIYYSYMVPILWVFSADACLSLVLGKIPFQWIPRLASFAAVVLLGVFFQVRGLVKEPLQIEPLETNSAITCLTNILRENEDFTWTICSANDELHMCEDYGYHYELIRLLWGMENSGAKGKIFIPTHYVYFFIEKRPLDYALSYEGSGQSVSTSGAKHALPQSTGLSIYQAKNRWIVMSRAYYWAKAYSELYPNEMQVYYESDDFICYRIEQNDYSLYNFAIDYGYNKKLHESDEEE